MTYLRTEESMAMKMPPDDNPIVAFLSVVGFSLAVGLLAWAFGTFILWSNPSCQGEALALGHCTLPVHEVKP